MLNEDLDINALKAEFKLDGRIRIENLLKSEIASRIRDDCLQEVPFETVYFDQGRYHATAETELAALTDQQKKKLNNRIMEAASRGVGFHYHGYMMKRSRHYTSQNLEFLHEVFEYFNSKELLSLINQVSGRDDLISADAQYTRFRPGHFLTRHRDEMKTQERRLAYVLGFSNSWHPDWGGLLQFYQEDGTPRDAWAPKFNTLSLFDIRHIHSVTYVTPFALEPRLSLTGWFRSVPKD